MATVNELALLTMSNELEVLAGRYQALSQSLYAKMAENNVQVVHLCEQTIAKVQALETVLDAFVSFVVEGADADKLQILQSFLFRNEN